MDCLTCDRSGPAQTAVAHCRHGADAPREGVIWQDPLPQAADKAWPEADIAPHKEQIAAAELTVAQLISTAWAAVSSFRGSDKRGGANGARIRPERENIWEVDVHMLAGMP